MGEVPEIGAGGYLVLLVLFADLALALTIEVFTRTRQVTRELLATRDVLRAAVPLGFFPLKTSLGYLAVLPLFQVFSEDQRHGAIAPLLRLPIASAFEILRSGERNVRHVINEIRTHAALLGFILLMYIAADAVKLAEAVPGRSFIMTIAATFKEVGASPEHSIEIPSACILAVLLIRLAVELRRWRTLLEEIEN